MEKLVQDASTLFNVHITARQMMSFVTYEKELLEWNSKFNLTAIRDSESIRTKHFLDSLSCSLAWKGTPPNRLIDVGTGAGFPGIPLKILYPNLKLTLVESVGKKAMLLLGGKLKQLIPVNLPGVADDRYLILVDKVAATPPKYPRKPGVPAKQPL